MLPGQVHYGFSESKEMTVEHSWGERIIPNFISMVAGQSLESCPLRASLRTASRSRPLGLSTHSAIAVSVFVFALLQPCSCATMLLKALGGALYIESITMYCPHVCSELANQRQVRILAIGTFTLSTPTRRRLVCQAEGPV